LATAANMPAVRAEASAKENVQSFPAEAQAPLAHSTHPQSKPGITFADEDSLPKLPIPELEGSCEKYVAALKPLQSPKEHRDTVQSVSDFLKADGPVLQQKLKKYASGKNNYIEQFWYDSYLNFDNPVVLNLNPFFLLEDDPTPARNNQVTRAASLVISALSFVRAVRREELPPDSTWPATLHVPVFSVVWNSKDTHRQWMPDRPGPDLEACGCHVLWAILLV